MSVRVMTGDCRVLLGFLPDQSIQCVVTSPPYYGLRDYGTGSWAGGDADCDHADRTFGKGRGDGVWYDGGKPYHIEESKPLPGPQCPRCGAIRTDSQMGLEASPNAYVAEMVDVFREVRRVLRDDGTLWLNLGDSIKGKDLMMMPARVALALQADGWFLRSDVIWHKPNPMPESVTDRPTSSHEHVFLLTKSARYFYDAEAVRETRTQDEDANTFRGGAYVGGQTDNATLGKRTMVGNVKLRPSMPKGSFGGKTADQAQPAFRADYGSRNLRNVWTIATAPFPGAHFATFPPELAERCIKAGTSEKGCCPQCGAPWKRIVGMAGQSNAFGAGGGAKAEFSEAERAAGGIGRMDGGRRAVDGSTFNNNPAKRPTRPQSLDWQPSCTCPTTEPIPCTVLDPFGGAGTVGLVADRLRRDAILIELSQAYAEMARNRVRDDAPLFTQVQ
jgi:DNA modification methylase